MRRIAATAVALLAAALLVFGTATGGDEGTYEVRAVFDNAGFLVPGEEVRIAGANVGVVSDIDLTTADEPAREDGTADPGKAVVVLRIDDPAFQDFRADASCLIRPQSLIGEKFVECEPTQPRAPGTEPPPELEQIPGGEEGEGQRLLPLENNGKSVDLDLVNNIMEAPYPDRFRLILNDLGAGLAARGEELAEIIERGNPALRETNQVLAILARQSRQLNQLAGDSDAILTELAAKRENVAGFINAATVSGEATAERSAELEAGLERLPGFLRELRSTMVELRAFSGAATPVFADLRQAAPSLTRATRALGPFANAGTGALESLGDAAEEAGPDIAAADPVIRDIRGLARSGEPATRNLRKTLASLRKTDGFRDLGRFVFRSVGAINAFDQYGHFLRALLPLNNCVDYETAPEPGCDANFTRPLAAAREALDRRRGRKDPGASVRAAAETLAGALSGSLGTGADEPRTPAEPPPSATTDPSAEPAQTTPEADVETPAPEPDAADPSDPADAASAVAPGAGRMRAARDLLEFLVGPRRGGGSR
jgi:ABC-type transporter Mla subunit MlaD